MGSGGLHNHSRLAPVLASQLLGGNCKLLAEIATSLFYRTFHCRTCKGVISRYRVAIGLGVSIQPGDIFCMSRQKNPSHEIVFAGEVLDVFAKLTADMGSWSNGDDLQPISSLLNQHAKRIFQVNAPLTVGNNVNYSVWITFGNLSDAHHHFDHRWGDLPFFAAVSLSDVFETSPEAL